LGAWFSEEAGMMRTIEAGCLAILGTFVHSFSEDAGTLWTIEAGSVALVGSCKQVGTLLSFLKIGWKII